MSRKVMRSKRRNLGLKCLSMALSLTLMPASFAADNLAGTLGEKGGYNLKEVSYPSASTITKVEYNSKTQTFAPKYYEMNLNKTEYGTNSGETKTYEVNLSDNESQTINFSYDPDNLSSNLNIAVAETVSGDFINLIGTSLTVSDYLKSVSGNFAENRYNSLVNYGFIGEVNADFIQNAGISASSTYYTFENHSDIEKIKGDFINNTKTSEDVQGNGYYFDSYAVGAALYNEGYINEIESNFINNSVTTEGNVASVVGGSGIYNTNIINNITGDFINNKASTQSASGNAEAFGGAIGNHGIINNITGDFINNKTTAQAAVSSWSDGGAIFNYNHIAKINGDFNSNEAVALSAEEAYSAGGAISNFYYIGEINGSLTGNLSSAAGDYYASSYGGAYSNWSITGNISADFMSNVSVAEGGDAAEALGGSIYNEGSIGDITGNFVNNLASSEAEYRSQSAGGAIYNHGNYCMGPVSVTAQSEAYIDPVINNITGDFVNNKVYSEAYFAQAQGGSITSHGTINDIVGNHSYNVAEAQAAQEAISSGGSISNQNFVNNINGNYTGNKAIATVDVSKIQQGQEDIEEEDIYPFSRADAAGGAIFNRGKINNITGVFSNNKVESKGIWAHSYGGAIANVGEPSYNVDGGDENSLSPNTVSCYQASGSCHAGEIGSIVNSSFYNNSAKAEADEYAKALGGAIYSIKDIKIVADKGISEFSGNYTETNGVKDDNAIYMGDNYAIITLEAKNNGTIKFNDNIDGEAGYKTVLTGDNTSSIILNNDVRKSYVSLDTTNLYMGKESIFDTSRLTLNSGSLSMVNNNVGVARPLSLTVNGDTRFQADVDLSNETMDRFETENYGDHSGNLIVDGMNILSDSTSKTAEIYFAQQGLKDNVALKTGDLPDSYQTTAYSPIFKYNVEYDNRDDAGYFVFSQGDRRSYSSYNPSVLATPVTAQTGAYITQMQVFEYAYQHQDNFMKMPLLDRMAIINQNRYAMSPTSDATDVGKFSPLYLSPEDNYIWIKPWTSFESIPLKNGPKVTNINYGSLFGYDGPMKHLKRGFEREIGYYLGYTGAHQNYSGITSNQNGGLLGTTATLYKGNFFNATTLSVGATTGTNHTMYGTEDFSLLTAGVGNKTGCNFEFKDGRFIIQPNFLISYTFANTFDYTNAAGVKIKSDPLNAIQLAPGIKFIGNTENGWQPYLTVNMIWNVLDKQKVTADAVRLPEMSIKPYVQYGVGVQKSFKDRFMGFGQALVQNGGRNGVSLTAGLRILLGKDRK